ncbi:unnamed protein product [Tilletia laevis]|uniref:Septum-promoting GTP-binding protein 1 n=1 Tax=Tilletia caries TaxID=13290 RepID=A0A177VFS4_9BASI|nr:hypothetical protein CF336_g1316 [Tilletia laevis]KAE8264434.1 hypothetical protein A4X03_0g944 [Tilletia caries]CAD6899671.1 unnamed protein product [Tilletia controversa]KAE8207974.1 hypothetical protein CF335_g751 [Tilletia laevis]CAD6886335.1 unnamed protein product [Tilletia caries]
MASSAASASASASAPPASSSSSSSSSSQSQPQLSNGAQSQDEGAERNSVIIKVGMVGDSQIGKTSLMVRYVEGSFNEDYIQTLGVNFMEKTISIRNTEITFSIWDLGGQREFVNMLPLVCNDAVAILFMFDLSRKSTLNSIKEWYRQARGFNKTAIPFLVGTKYDQFATFAQEEQEEITKQARRFARAMKAPLIFSSTSHSINVQKIFKIILSKAFDLKCTIPEIKGIGEPLLIYVDV